MPLRNFTNGCSGPQRLGDNPRLNRIGPLPIAAPSTAICEKLQWSVHGETPALTSISAQSQLQDLTAAQLSSLSLLAIASWQIFDPSFQQAIVDRSAVGADEEVWMENFVH
ncbi:hypothetical protein [Devosia soli]|uniref:hypothetical protein n=1 Tax=Devosia soli TaxID=361041 RepID=UPI001FCE1890|nr:hypothetical protein [Devosia soli]